MTTQERTRELLRLARDACTGLAAFAALPTGDVVVVASPGDTSPAMDEGIIELARRVLDEAGEHAAEAYWGSAPKEEALEQLRCVSFPIRRDGATVAVLGVVDVLLPEVDRGIEQILQRITAELAGALEPAAGELELEPEPGAPAALALPADAQRHPSLLGAMVEELPEGVLLAGADGLILYANRTFATLAHRGPEELLVSDVRALLSEEPADPGAAPGPGEVGRLLGTGVLGRRLDLRLPGGRSIPVDVRGRRIEVGVVGECYAALVRDARQPLLGPVEAAGAALLEEILDCIDDAIAVCDADERVVLANRAASRLLLPEGGELAGRPFPFSSELRTPEGSPVRYEDHPVLRALHGTTVVAEHIVLEGPQDLRRHLLVSARPFGVSGSTGALVIAREITAQLDQEARLMQLALHDPLTGLANRYLLLDYLQRTFRQVRSRGGAMALLYLDLDDFKAINDTHGHDVGDEVLVAVAGRLQGATRGSDLVARLSGDEFVIVATAASLESESIEILIGRLRQVLSAPYHIRDHLLSVGASIGWVIADPQVEDPMTLLVRADEAMYRQKQARGVRRGGETGW